MIWYCLRCKPFPSPKPSVKALNMVGKGNNQGRSRLSIEIEKDPEFIDAGSEPKVAQEARPRPPASAAVLRRALGFPLAITVSLS